MKSKKPLGYKNYGSIPHLIGSKLGKGDHHIHEGQNKILTEKKRDKHDEIIVTEKYDGSNVGIAKKDGSIYALTRSGYEAHTSPYEQHHIFSEWVNKRKDFFEYLLNEGDRICGEWMYSPHGIKYKCENDPIVFFDYFRDNSRMSHQFTESLRVSDDIPFARVIHRGDSIPVDRLISILNKKTYSISPDENPEGMVYRVERKGKVDFLAKWVRDDFVAGKYLFEDRT